MASNRRQIHRAFVAFVITTVGVIAYGCDSAVDDPPHEKVLNVLSPNGGEVVKRGDPLVINYAHANVDSIWWRITKGGVTFQATTDSVTAGDPIQVALDESVLPGNDYRVVLSAGALRDSSENFFKIESGGIGEQCLAGLVPGSLIPMAVGNRWDLQFWIKDDRVVDTLRVEFLESVNFEYAGDQLHGFAQAAYRTRSYPGYRWIVFGSKPDGIYKYGAVAPDDTLAMRQLELPYPASVGTKSSFVRITYGGEDGVKWAVHDTLEVELVATDESIETPAGTFNAYVYKYYNPPPSDVAVGDDIYDYYVPGLGQVAQIWRSPTSGSTKYQYLLVDYCLKPGS